MAGTTQIYRVSYHFEASRGPSNWGGASGRISHDYVDYVQCASGDYSPIKTVLSNNSRLLGGGTLIIDQVVNVGPSGNILI